jgi:NTP pyrophosphatase (non-canonical NTP hydrolase)
MSGGKFVEDMIEEAHGWKDRLAVESSPNLNVLRDECFGISKSKGFHDASKSVGDYIALMHSELSEALEDHRKGKAPAEYWYTTPRGYRVDVSKGGDDLNGGPTKLYKPCGIPSEMADVIIRVLDFCGAMGIDIEKAVKEKIAYNKTRPHKHGKIL